MKTSRNLVIATVVNIVSIALVLASAKAHAMGKRMPKVPRDITQVKAWESNDLSLEERKAIYEQLAEELMASNGPGGVVYDQDVNLDRCSKAQGITGDNLANVEALVLGRTDWSIKCVDERVASAESQLSKELQSYLSKDISDPAVNARFKVLVRQEPAYRYRERFLAQQRLLKMKRGYKGQSHNGLIYPVWGVPGEGDDLFSNPVLLADGKTKWVAPTVSNTSCDAIPGYKGKRALEFYQPIAYCESGCFAPGQRILTANGWKSAETFSNLKDRGLSLMTLGPDAVIEDALLAATPVQSVVNSLEAEIEELVTLTTESGKSLTVTTNHPMLTSNGVMRPAGQLHSGDVLLATDGTKVSADAIVRLDTFSARTKVTNFRMASDDLKRNVVVSEGLLTGTSYYQNELRDQLNRGLVRLSIPFEVLF